MVSVQELPRCFRWNGQDNPVPTRRLPRGTRLPRGFDGRLGNGETREGFDFTHCLQLICADIARRCPQLAHVDVSRLLIGMTHARNRRRHGLQARLTPLRFEGGKLLRVRRGVTYCLQRYFLDEREMLYHMTFCLPRFFDQDFQEKLVTIFHELYHIDPAFNGELRRHAGRCHMHAHSKRGYDERMATFVGDYLATRPDSALHDALRLNWQQLLKQHGVVRGIVVARPKVIPVA